MESKATSSVNLLVTIILLFVTSFVLANKVVESAYVPRPSEDYQVQKCASEIGETCGNSIFHYVFGAGKHVSKECCTILLNAGERCHDLLTTVTIRIEHFPEQQAKEIRRKNDKVWEFCKRRGQISN
ncbi:hypothetical protein RND81_05G203200 [Saponaria officinalis]|uniref:Prolamin-like domain-containing protein n=1 Tax=Saponaria officinalis TaxID=3572 RepID=A0AAW1L2R5_SAPOF